MTVAGSESRRIAPGEWAWVATASLLVMAYVSVPYLVGLSRSTSHMAFQGHLFGLDDMHSYIAKMRFGAYDGWLLQFVYTSEPHRAGFAYLHFIALGKLTALISGEGPRLSAGTLTAAYHGARIVCGLLLLLVLYRFVAHFLDGQSQRRLAWALAAVSGGVGWLPVALASMDVSHGPARLPVEFYVPEGFTILLLYGLPHLSLARTLLLTGWLALFRAVETGDWRRALVAGLAWSGMGMIVPFYIGLLGVLIAAWLAVLILIRRRFPWHATKLAMVASGPPLLLLAYNVWLFTAHPVFASWAVQNDLPSPPPLDYLMAYGLLLLLSLPGVIGLLRDGLDERSALLIVWPLIAGGLVYLPINVQRRLLEGVIVPISLLATLGIWRLLGLKMENSRAGFGYRLRQVALGMIIMLTWPSPFMLISGGVLTASRVGWPVFEPAEELAAMQWLRDQAPFGSVVLSSSDSGNLLPMHAGVRVYIGHGPETVGFSRKSELVRAFFAGGMTDSERQALLQEAGIDYVWLGPPERFPECVSRCFDPLALGLRAVYSSDAYTIYEVRR